MTHKEFATLLVAWRKENDFTQQEAADRLGISRRSLENWEQQRAMPQGIGLGAVLRAIRGKDDAPVGGKAVRHSESESTKPKGKDFAPEDPALDTHLL